MVAERLWTPTGEYDAEGHGYDPSRGGIVRRCDRDAPGDPDELVRLLRDVALCNDARLSHDDTGWSVAGDPLEGALLVVAAKGGQDAADLASAWVRTGEEAFDHQSRRMITTHLGPEGHQLTVGKGAPEAVLSLLARDDDVRRAEGAGEALAGEGYRVIAVADGGATAGFRLVGLVGIDDTPREHSRNVVAACRRAAIRLMLVTGDHPGTARAVAERVGIVTSENENADEVVFARVRHEEKVGIVRELQERGEVVAMLGDGVNDAPALRRADIGVAAGLGGTEVARQAADLVLMDDDLSTVVTAVEEGRRIFANIRSFLLYAVSGGLAEVGVMLLGPAIGIAQPLLPAQILWINLLTHGLTGVAFGAEPADPAEMARPPRPPDQSVFTPRFTTHLAVAATSLVVTALLVGSLVVPDAEQRTAVFLTLGLGQLAVAWAIRSRPDVRTARARGLELAIAAAAVLLVEATMFYPLQLLLGTHALEAAVLGTAVLAATIPGGVMRLAVNHERAKASTGAGQTREDNRAE
jgi:P-type Ca2+ transporter type 2C